MARFTRREWYTICVIGSVNFSTAICVALQAPFYPQEAENKGATASEYGLVFGIFEFVSFVISPLFGKYMDTLGANFLLCSGAFLAGASSMLFGLLDMVYGRLPFISLSFAIRIVESVGASAAVTASFSIIAVVFPQSVATTFAMLETLYGLGYIVGPTVGGFLFTLGGFQLPFYAMGAVLVLDGVVIYFALPPLEDEDKFKRPQAQLWSYLKVIPVLLDSLAMLAASIGTGFYQATLEPHIRQFGMTPVTTGLMFIISGGMYAIVAPLVGKLCDSRVNPKKMIALGHLFVILSFVLVGPAPFTPLPSTLWMCILGLICHGFGNGCILVSAFIDAIRSATASGLPDDITTYGVVSGLWASSFALGACVGPSVAGVLFDLVGFRPATLFVIVVHTIMFLAITIYLCCARRPPLLRDAKIDAKTDVKEVIHLSSSWSHEPFPAHSGANNGNNTNYGAFTHSVESNGIMIKSC